MVSVIFFGFTDSFLPVPTLNSITIIVMIELYKIKEIAHRQYHMIIDVDHFSKLIPFIQEIGTSVWLLEKKSHQHSWESICEVIPSLGIKPECMIRNMSYECFFSNPAFLSLLLNWRGDLHVVLTNTVPPYFVDSSRGEDPSWYHLLQNKLDYRAEIYIPGTLDYGWIISPSKSVLELFMDLVGHLSDKAL